MTSCLTGIGWVGPGAAGVARSARGALIVGLSALVVGALAGPASGAMVSFGSSLSTVPTLDTANGAFGNSGNGTEQSIVTGGSNFVHDGTDATLWNQSLPNSAPVGAQDGQVLSIKVEGCAIEDRSAPTQQSEGTPVNAIVFQTLTPNSDGSYTPQGAATSDGTGAQFMLPFCSNPAPNVSTGAVNTSTVTTYTPIHLCVANGDLVTFHTIGGFIPAGTGGSSGGPWYPQGIPMDVIAQVPGSTLNSYIGFPSSSAPYNGRYGAGIPTGAGEVPSMSGFGAEPGEQLSMQVIEGTVEDAYALCPGGKATEPGNANTNLCVAENNPPAGYTPCPGFKGGTGTTGSTGPSGTTTLVVGKLRLSKYAFAASKGTTITYQDNLAGTTTLTVTKKGKSTVLFHTTHQDTAGLNTVTFLDRSLKKGFYTLTITTTFSGQPTQTNSVTMRIVSSPRHGTRHQDTRHRHRHRKT